MAGDDRSQHGRVLLAAALGCLVLLGAVGGIRLLRAHTDGPAATVERYLGALADAHATEALGQLASHPASPLLTAEVLAAEVRRDPIRDVSTTVTRSGDGRATVQASYRQGDLAVTRDLTLHTTRAGGHLLGPGPRWVIDGGALETLTVTTERPRAVAVEGVSLPGGTAAVLPGRLLVTSPGDPLVADASELADLRTPGGTGAIHLGTALRPAVKAAAVRKATATLTRCTRSGLLDPPGCPFSAHPHTPTDIASNVTWHLVGAPTVTLGEPSGSVVSLTGTATMRVTYLELGSGGSATERTQDVTAHLAGTVRAVSGRLVATVD